MNKHRYFFLFLLTVFFACANNQTSVGSAMEWIGISKDGAHFIELSTGKPFLIWGVNYDRDYKSRLLDDYWAHDWATVVEDFDEMKELGLNTVRIHLQVGRFMDSPTQMNEQALNHLAHLIHVAEERQMYLYVTGLACYLKANVPAWYDELDEKGRWDAQAVFWKNVAKTCASSPAVLCYDLMNEPVVHGGDQNIDVWLPGEGLGNFFYVQHITRTPAGRTSHEIAKAWIDHLVAAIRTEDTRHLTTLGVIPWAVVWPTAKPLFYDPEVGQNLDFVSVHFYPKTNEVEKELKALAVYKVGRPLVIAEMFPINCGIEDMDKFIDGSKAITQGWISFYWGKTIEEYEQENSFDGNYMKKWLEYYREKGKQSK